MWQPKANHSGAGAKHLRSPFDMFQVSEVLSVLQNFRRALRAILATY
jgi:hypothetical protein